MSAVGVVVIAFMVVCAITILLCAYFPREQSVKLSRMAGNLRRESDSRRRGGYQYLHEASNGSVLWRRVSTD